MAFETPEPPDLNERGDSPSKSHAPACKENLDCGGQDALGAPVVVQVTISLGPKADVRDDSLMETAVVRDIPEKSDIVVDTSADDSPHNDVGIIHPGPAGIPQVDGGLMGGPVEGSLLAENVKEITMRNTGKRLMSDQEMPSFSSNPAAQVPKSRPSQGEFGKILQISQWSLTHRIQVCEILQDSGQHWRVSIRSRHEYARQSDAIVVSGPLRIEPLTDPRDPLDGFDPKNWESNLEKLEVEMEKSCFQSWAQLTTDLESKLETLRNNDEKERWYVACRENGFQAQEIFRAVEEGNLEAFKTRMGEIGIEYWTLRPREYGGATPLHWAALHGQEDMVSFMLERMQNWTASTDATGMLEFVNAHDAFGFTPLHMALFPTLWLTYRYPEDSLEDIIIERDELAMSCSHMIDSLFKMGATLDKICRNEKFRIITGDIRDDSRAYFVASSDYDLMYGYYSQIVHPLALAVCIAHPSLLEKFVEKLKEEAFEPISRDCENVLHLVARGRTAAFFERGRVMTILLSHSSQYSHQAKIVNLQTKDKRTPLHIAIAWGNHECVAALLESPEVKEDIPDKNGHTPFSIARKLVEMSKKTGVVRDMVDLYQEHSRKFQDGKFIHIDMPMSNFNYKPGRFSRNDCDDIATKIFGLMIRKELQNKEEVVELFVECIGTVHQIDQFSRITFCDKQLRKILQMSQWSLTYRIYICKLLRHSNDLDILGPPTRKEYAEQSHSLIKMNLQSDENTFLASTIRDTAQDLGVVRDWSLMNQFREKEELTWKKLASELEKEQDTLREKDTHENWYKAFAGKAFQPHEIFEAVELNLFPLAQWMMNQVTKSLLEIQDCTGITPGEYRGATPLHWAMLHGNRAMVGLMIEQATKLEDAFNATLANQDEFGFKPIHMAILSSFMDECFPKWDLTNLNFLVHLNSSKHTHPKSNEHAYIVRSVQPYLFRKEESKHIIKICNRTIFGANKVLSLIELAIYIAKEQVVKDLMVRFVGFVKPSNEDTLLHFAARGFNSDYKTIMNLVLRHLHLQPNMLNSCNKDGETPLHIAILQRKPALVFALLRCHYIKVDIPNKKGLIPLQVVNGYVEHLIRNHPQDQRHMQLLQLSQWSLRHRILAIQMFAENATKFEKIKDIYMQQCWLIVGGDNSRTKGAAELTDIANKLREKLKKLAEFRWSDRHQVSLREGFISIEEGDYPMNTFGDIYQHETSNELHVFDQLHRCINQATEDMIAGCPEYTGANWLHWAVLHGRVDMVDSICSKLKAEFMHKEFVPSPIYKYDREQKSAIRDGFEARWAEFKMRWAKIVDARDGFGFTPLHLVAFSFPWRSDPAFAYKDVELVEKLCENKFPHSASRGPRSYFKLWNCSHDGGRYTIYADDNFPTNSDVYPIQLAVHTAHPRILEKLLEKCSEETFVKTHSSEDTILHAAKAWNALIKRSGEHWRRIESILLKLLDSPSISKAVNVRNNDRETPLHKAVKTESLEWVEVILQCEHIKFNLRDREKSTPREVALQMFKKHTAKESASLVSGWTQQWFSNKTPPKESPLEKIIELINTYDPESMPQERETLQRERQVYVDAANAILVGAALITSVSFGAWLQPPLGYQAYYSSEFQDTSPTAPPGTYESYVAIKHHWILQMFWIFNSLAFFFSLATVIAGADAAIPWQETELKKAVYSVRHAVKIASALLGVAIGFVICTFATLGFAILPPIEKYRINMWCTLTVGVAVCSVVLIRLLRKLVLSGSQTTGSPKPTQRRRSPS